MSRGSGALTMGVQGLVSEAVRPRGDACMHGGRRAGGHLVDDDGGVAGEEEVRLDLAQQDAVRHKLDLGVTPHPLLVPHLPPAPPPHSPPIRSAPAAGGAAEGSAGGREGART